MRRFRPNLRLRLGLGASVLALLALLAAGIAVFGLARTQRLATEAMAAQHRIEAFSSLSARVNEWMLGRLMSGSATGRGDSPSESSFAVMATFALLEVLINEDVQATTDAAATSQRQRQILTLARIRGQFVQLENSLARMPLNSPEGEAAVNYYGTRVPALIAGQIQHDARRRDAAMASMGQLRNTLDRLAIAVAVVTPLILAALHVLLVRPLIARLQGAARGDAVGSDGSGAHDELSMALARIRQRTARLDRRQRGLAQDYARLEGIVAERTAELSHANARLSQADAERRRFFADVSHELRTPLTVILGEAELGLRDPDPARRGTFATIQSRAMRLYRRIEDLLRIARSESGQLDLQREAVDLVTVIRAAEADLLPILKRAGVVCRIGIPQDVSVLGDADWLRQVFAGLFDNAAKYAGKGAVLTITCQTGEGGVVLDLTDTGPGMAPDRLVGALDRFTRGDARTQGFGVGLALARWVIEAQGGSIRIYSPVLDGRGLGLRITLPKAATRLTPQDTKETAPA